MASLIRTNPRKLKMPLLKETACAGATTGVLATSNILLLPKLPPNSAAIAVAAELGAAVLLSNKYPIASASAAGALLSAVFSVLGAAVTKDLSLIAWNPQMARDLTGNGEGYAGFPDNLRYALGA